MFNQPVFCDRHGLGFVDQRSPLQSVVIAGDTVHLSVMFYIISWEIEKKWKVFFVTAKRNCSVMSCKHASSICRCCDEKSWRESVLLMIIRSVAELLWHHLNTCVQILVLQTNLVLHIPGRFSLPYRNRAVVQYCCGDSSCSPLLPSSGQIRAMINVWKIWDVFNSSLVK